jgi:hypothetical protein
VYALTNRRAVVFHRFSPFEDSFTENDIQQIVVRERSTIGDISLRTGFGKDQTFTLTPPGSEFIGVEDPRHVAELIRSTLAPGIEVKSA